MKQWGWHTRTRGGNWLIGGQKFSNRNPCFEVSLISSGKSFKRTRHVAYQVEDSGFLAFASGIFLCEVFGSRIYSYSWILQGLSRYFWSRSSIHWMGMIQWSDDGDVGTFYYIKLGNKNLLVFCCKKIDFFFLNESQDHFVSLNFNWISQTVVRVTKDYYICILWVIFFKFFLGYGSWKVF